MAVIKLNLSMEISSLRFSWRRARAAAFSFIACWGLAAGAPDALAAGGMSRVPPPALDARSYALLDFRTGALLAEKNAHEKLGPASITKVMTVYVTALALRDGLVTLQDQVLVSEKAWKMGGSRMFIEVGKRVSVEELLNGVIIQSGNDASVALAEHVSGSEEVFAALMNEQAKQLGMVDSHFANATGWPHPETYSTAYDLTLLAAALIREFPEIYARFSHKEFVFNGIRQPNRNRLLARDPSVDGIKTGHTEDAGYCLLSSAVENGTRLIAAVMGTSSDAVRTESSHALLSYGQRFFETRELYAPDATIMQAKVWGGDAPEVLVGVERPLALTFPRGRFDELQAQAVLEEPVMAPLQKGQTIGTLTIRLDEEVLATEPLVARDAVAEGSLTSRLVDQVMLWFE